jgi:TolB-like protein/DNA-binding winged helix-turn-helix (wHTH) protein/tetratricopeptide (TPR) repeat protein
MRKRSTSVVSTVYEFGGFRLDSGRFELSRAGRSVKLERKPMELLILLAARNGDLITRTEIAECLWDKEVFVDTEHGINTAIRKIRYVLGDDSEEPRFVQTVMGKGYRFVGPVVAIQAAPAEVMAAPGKAWSPPKDDVPASGLPLEQPGAQPVEQPGGATVRQRKSRLLVWIAAAAVLALLIVGVSLRARSWKNHAPKPEITSLAVLPLNNLSGDPGQEYFADGMTDELTTMLAKDSTLRVISRTSAMQFKDPHSPLRDIASSLGVDGIVEGSISRANGKVHMTVQLIHAPSDTHLWAESYDRDNSDVAMMPEQAAQSIARRLNASVAATRAASYVNPEAHDAYLQGKFHLFTDGGGGAYFKKAVEIQPDYAAGWAGLAQYYGSNSGVSMDPRQANGQMMLAARKAAELDDSLPEAHAALGAALFYSQWDWAGGERETRRAIQLDPEYSEAHHRLAEMLAILNRHQEAIAEQKIATELDPFERTHAMALVYQLARQYDLAIVDLKQRLAATPRAGALLSTLADVYRCKGMYKEWAETWVQILTIWNLKDGADATRQQYAQGGYKAVFRGRIAYEEKQSTTRYISPYDLAQSYAELKQKEKTLDLLEEGLRVRDPNLLYVQCDPAFDFLHTDERYRDIIRRIGLPPAWS